jgi:hypothetical protein
MMENIISDNLNLLLLPLVLRPRQSFLLSNAVIGTYCRLYLVDTNLNTPRNPFWVMSITKLKLVLKGVPNKNRRSS